MLGTLDELAARIGGRVVGDGSVRVALVATVDEAGADALTFATSEAYLAAALAGNAAAILVAAALSNEASSKPLIVVENVRHALAQLLESLRAARPAGPFLHPTAAVEADARL